jgi:signal transduction histidine kinase/ligand-binding sensor domain-containing protein
MKKKANSQKKINKSGCYKSSIGSLLSSVTHFFCLLLILLFSLASHAQVEQPPLTPNFHQWGAVTLFNGLPSDNVRAIAQTPDGILWFGTDNGLAQFDGRRIQSITLDNAETNKILTLQVFDDGALWIGTRSGVIRRKNGKFLPIEETRNLPVKAILQGALTFIATENGVILKLQEIAENVFQTEKIPAQTLFGSDGLPLNVTSLAQTGDRIIAGTRSRSILLIENNQTFETFSRPRPFFINALAKDKVGNAWLGADSDNSGSGLFLLRDVGRPQRIGTGLGNVLSIEPDDSGGIWVGTGENGLFHFRGETQLKHFTFENTAGGLRSNTVNALFVDREGVLWAATNRGVCRFDSSSPFNTILSENGNSNFVRMLYQASNGQIFAGTNRGLFLFSDGGWLEAGNFSQKTIYFIGEDSSKQLLVGTSSGLYGSDEKQKSAGEVRSVADFQGRTYVAVFGKGVVALENQMQILSNESAIALFADSDRLWIGTARDGVFVFDGKNAIQENSLDALRGAAIWKIAAGNENSLWLASERGLFLYQDKQLSNVVTNQDVRDVLVHGKDIWAATSNGGLLHLKNDERFGWVSTDLNAEQGLPSQKVFSLLKVESRLLIGTNRGVVNYRPGNVPPKIIPTRILSRRLHTVEELTQTIALNYPQNSLLVEAAGLSSRTFPEQFQYGFLLKNERGEIIEKKISNEAQFAPSNLLPGEYIIEAQVFNKDLVASEPLVIKFSVARAPFPMTAASLGILLAVALIALIWAVIERRQIAQRNRELAAARFDLANEAERERKRIAQDLHDQTLADLRNLMLMSDKITGANGKFRSEIEAVSSEIRRICEDLSPSVLENVGLLAALEFLLSHTVENYRFSADESEEQLQFSPNVQMQIYRIAQEVLNNIRRHGNAEFVEMKIYLSETNDFILNIEDDGIAFHPAQNATNGRGISNIKARAALIEAEIAWLKSENGGTNFQLKKKI